MKTSKKTLDFYFSVYYSILEFGKLPENLNISKQSRNYYVNILKREGIIEKIGYGTWIIKKNIDIKKYILQFKEVKKDAPRYPPHAPKIRGHSFMIKLQIPVIANWKIRREFYKKENIAFKPLMIRGQGERIFFKGRKIWITNRSIFVYEKSSYITDTAEKSKSYAIYHFLELIKSLENLFKVSFKINKLYKFKVCKAHYSRLSCELARQYRKDKKRLYVKQKDGTTWMWTDYSLNIDETETGNLERSDQDMDKIVSPLLNDLRDHYIETGESIVLTPVLKALTLFMNSQGQYAENINEHIGAIKTLSFSVDELKNQVLKISRVITSLKK